MTFKKKTKPQDLDEQQKIADVLKNLYALFYGKERVLDAFESKIFPINTKGSGYLNFKPSNLKILTHKQMLPRFPIVLAQVKAGNNLERLLNDIRQIVYFLYQSNKNTKKVLRNGKGLRKGQKSVALSNLSIYYISKYIKISYNNNKFKISAPTWSDAFKLPDGSYLISDFQDYLEYILKKRNRNTCK